MNIMEPGREEWAALMLSIFPYLELDTMRVYFAIKNRPKGGKWVLTHFAVASCFFYYEGNIKSSSNYYFSKSFNSNNQYERSLFIKFILFSSFFSSQALSRLIFTWSSYTRKVVSTRL